MENITIERLPWSQFDHVREQLVHLLKKAVVNNFAESKIDDSYYLEKCDEAGTYLKDGKAVIYLAYKGEKAVGWIWSHRIDRFDKHRFHIASIAVDKEYEHLGIGSRLVAAVEEFARINNADGIDLLVTADNLNAVEFYRNRGYETERLLMRKDFS